MVRYCCERCGKEDSQESHYDSHNRHKTPCENLIVENEEVNTEKAKKPIIEKQCYVYL